MKDGGKGQEMSEYKIPKEIKDKIPTYFYCAMAGELVSVFGPQILTEEDGYYDLRSSTIGWTVAFRISCIKLGLQWLDDYYKDLEWDESDLFDGEIEDKIVEIFCKPSDGTQFSSNDYCLYLIHKYL